MSGMEPVLLGAALGAATSKNPIQGAMLGGMGGAFAGPMLSGLGGATTAAGTTAAGATSALPTAAFTGQAVSPALNAAPFAMNPAGLPAIGNSTVATGMGQGTGLIPSSAADQSLLGTISGGFDNISKYAQQNPTLTKMAMQGGQSLLSQQPTMPPPAGLMRGNPTQMQPQQYQVGVPKVSLI